MVARILASVDNLNTLSYHIPHGATYLLGVWFECGVRRAISAWGAIRDFGISGISGTSNTRLWKVVRK